MKQRSADTIIRKFIKNVKFFWQMTFIIGILSYGLSFLYRFQANTTIRNIDLINFLNWGSFFIAIALAFYILHIKRSYFRLGYFQKFLEESHKDEPELEESHLIRRFTRHIGSKMKRVWTLGLIIILLGVIYYWITYDSWNMHIYFVVGLYSLVINYPRSELFNDVPYLLKEILSAEKGGTNPPDNT